MNAPFIVTNQKVGNSTKQTFAFYANRAVYSIEPYDASWVIVADLDGDRIVLRDFGSWEQARDELKRIGSVTQGTLDYTYTEKEKVKNAGR